MRDVTSNRTYIWNGQGWDRPFFLRQRNERCDQQERYRLAFQAYRRQLALP